MIVSISILWNRNDVTSKPLISPTIVIYGKFPFQQCKTSIVLIKIDKFRNICLSVALYLSFLSQLDPTWAGTWPYILPFVYICLIQSPSLPVPVGPHMGRYVALYLAMCVHLFDSIPFSSCLNWAPRGPVRGLVSCHVCTFIWFNPLPFLSRLGPTWAGMWPYILPCVYIYLLQSSSLPVSGGPRLGRYVALYLVMCVHLFDSISFFSCLCWAPCEMICAYGFHVSFQVCTSIDQFPFPFLLVLLGPHMEW